MLQASRAPLVVSRPQRRSVVVKTAAHEATVTQAASAPTQGSYYVVMNVFKVKADSGAAFEEVWRTRESHLKEMPGFVRFAMLRCENVPGKYISQTYWASKEAFQNWAQSSQFKASHGTGGQGQQGAKPRPNTMDMLEGPPSPEFFSTVTITE